MENAALYSLLREIVSGFVAKDPSYQPLPEDFQEETTLNDLGLDITTLPEVIAELESRLGGRDLRMEDILTPSDVNTMTLGDLIREIKASLGPRKANPQVVYVDDEEENLFIFKRKFGNKLNLRTFTDSIAALAYIKAEDSVSLVITDEVMPIMGGNALCDEVHKAKPMLKFILLTGNPNNDDDLLYRSLRQSRFFEFISKPVDLEGKGEEYLKMFREILNSGE